MPISVDLARPSLAVSLTPPLRRHCSFSCLAESEVRACRFATTLGEPRCSDLTKCAGRQRTSPELSSEPVVCRVPAHIISGCPGFDRDDDRFSPDIVQRLRSHSMARTSASLTNSGGDGVVSSTRASVVSSTRTSIHLWRRLGSRNGTGR